MFAIYLGALLFGGLLIASSAFGGDHGEAHGGDVHTGGDHGDAHETQASAWLSLFGLRFWSFGTAFFGLTGLVLRALGWSAIAPFVATGLGVAAGLGASATFRAIGRDTVGEVKGASALLGREGKLLLPVEPGQRGKVRLGLPGGGHLDLVAESEDPGAIPAGSDVLVIEIRGNVAVVARATADLPATRT
jgi:membrane protein implicated in regulation of membrane protease activity